MAISVGQVHVRSVCRFYDQLARRRGTGTAPGADTGCLLGRHVGQRHAGVRVDPVYFPPGSDHTTAPALR